MKTVLLVYIAGLILGLVWTWLKSRQPMDPIGGAITVMFGIVFSIFWPIVVAYCVAMGALVLVRSAEEIEP